MRDSSTTRAANIISPSEPAPSLQMSSGANGAVLDLYQHNLHCLERDFGEELTPEVRAKLANKVSKFQAFLAGRTKSISPDSGMFDYAGKRNAFMGFFSDDGMTQQDYLDIVLEAPQFLYLDMRVTNERAQKVVDHFADDGLTRPLYSQSVWKGMPQVMSLTDWRVIHHLEAPMGRYGPKGLEREQYLQMALKHTNLMATKAATVYQKMDFMLAMTDLGVFTPSEGQLDDADGSPPKALFNYLVNAPTKLSYGIDNYLLRADWVMRGPKEYKGFGIMLPGRTQLCEQYKENFGYEFSSKRVRANNPILYNELEARGLWRGVDSTRKGVGGPRPPKLEVVSA